MPISSAIMPEASETRVQWPARVVVLRLHRLAERGDRGVVGTLLREILAEGPAGDEQREQHEHRGDRVDRRPQPGDQQPEGGVAQVGDQKLGQAAQRHLVGLTGRHEHERDQDEVERHEHRGRAREGHDQVVEPGDRRDDEPAAQQPLVDPARDITADRELGAVEQALHQRQPRAHAEDGRHADQRRALRADEHHRGERGREADRHRGLPDVQQGRHRLADQEQQSQHQQGGPVEPLKPTAHHHAVSEQRERGSDDQGKVNLGKPR